MLYKGTFTDYQSFKATAYCDGGRHHSSTASVVGDITVKKTTGKNIQL